MLQARARAAPSKRLANKVVVVTGASAGVGRAIAMAAAREGARVGLIARSEEALSEVAAKIEKLGSAALALPCDVADGEAVDEACARAEALLGPVEIWVDAAMLTVFSPVWRLTPDEVRRVTEATYLGAVNGTLAALARMRPRGRGTIVQIGSALGFRGIPLQAPYCAAKHAIRGFTASLRAELIHEKCPVRLVEVHLPAVNTPQFAWARTHMHETPRPVGAIYSPEVAADAVMRALAGRARDYWLGASTFEAILGQALAPALMDKLMARSAWEGQFTGRPALPREGNLEHTVEALHAMNGPFADKARQSALMAPGPAVRLGLAGVGAAALALAGFAAGRLAGRR